MTSCHPAVFCRELELLDQDMTALDAQWPDKQLDAVESLVFLNSNQSIILRVIERVDWILVNGSTYIVPERRAWFAEMKAQMSRLVLDHFVV